MTWERFDKGSPPSQQGAGNGPVAAKSGTKREKVGRFVPETPGHCQCTFTALSGGTPGDWSIFRPRGVALVNQSLAENMDRVPSGCP